MACVLRLLGLNIHRSFNCLMLTVIFTAHVGWCWCWMICPSYYDRECSDGGLIPELKMFFVWLFCVFSLWFVLLAFAFWDCIWFVVCWCSHVFLCLCAHANCFKKVKPQNNRQKNKSKQTQHHIHKTQTNQKSTLTVIFRPKTVVSTITNVGKKRASRLFNNLFLPNLIHCFVALKLLLNGAQTRDK